MRVAPSVRPYTPLPPTQTAIREGKVIYNMTTLHCRNAHCATILTRLLDKVLRFPRHHVQATYRFLQICVNVVQHFVLLVQLLRNLQAEVQSPQTGFATHDYIGSGRSCQVGRFGETVSRRFREMLSRRRREGGRGTPWDETV